MTDGRTEHGSPQKRLILGEALREGQFGGQKTVVLLLAKFLR
jgi:hypothetical protein